MRLNAEEIDALAYAHNGLAPERVALFGSRVEPDGRGGESVEKPLEYYDNNVHGTLQLLAAMRRANVKTLKVKT